MRNNLFILVAIAMLFLAYITIVTGFPSREDDDQQFTLRELAQAMMAKRSTHSNIISTAAATKKLYRLNKKRNTRETSYEYSFPLCVAED
jgi:hypothetical protein